MDTVFYFHEADGTNFQMNSVKNMTITVLGIEMINE